MILMKNFLQQLSFKRCITAVAFQENSRFYEFESLPTGNYSIKVRAISIARYGSLTQKFFSLVPTYIYMNQACWSGLLFFIEIWTLSFLVHWNVFYWSFFPKLAQLTCMWCQEIPFLSNHLKLIMQFGWKFKNVYLQSNTFYKKI